jgi:hypothetical protein
MKVGQLYYDRKKNVIKKIVEIIHLERPLSTLETIGTKEYSRYYSSKLEDINRFIPISKMSKLAGILYDDTKV